MENDQRPRFNQETGERIIYDDERGNQEVNQHIDSVKPVEPAPPLQESIPEPPLQEPVSVQQGVPTQQPEQPARVVQEKSGGSGCLKGCLIICVICLILVGLLAGGGYAFYKMNQPKEVKFDETDVESFYDKVGIDNNDYIPSIEEILAGEALPSGEVDIDNNFTSAEITSVIQDASGRNDYFEDVNVRFIGEDQVEVFATVSDDINDIYDIAPDLKKYAFVIDRLKGQQLYYVGDVLYNQGVGFELNVAELKVGLFKISANMINEYDSTVESLLNSTVDNMSGFDIESMKINADSLDFVGTIPEKLK